MRQGPVCCTPSMHHDLKLKVSCLALPLSQEVYITSVVELHCIMWTCLLADKSAFGDNICKVKLTLAINTRHSEMSKTKQEKHYYIMLQNLDF